MVGGTIGRELDGLGFIESQTARRVEKQREKWKKSLKVAFGLVQERNGLNACVSRHIESKKKRLHQTACKMGRVGERSSSTALPEMKESDDAFLGKIWSHVLNKSASFISS